MNERDIFVEALEKSPAEQAVFLDEACANDEPLRQRVEILLKSHNDAGSFLEKPPAEFVPTIATGEFDTVDEGGGEISLDFLEPSDKPGCIGTLGLYQVIEVVGRGGMGLVLRAHDTKLDRVVAIKVMAPELAANQMAVKRFLREARAAAAVSHDHVVTIFAIDEENKPPFIVMECVDGLSLQERIDNEGALELKEILRIGMQTAAGLTAAHKQGLVHRDIKPANILLENGIERVKITDFGLARAVDDVSVTQTGQIAGTPQFMSPEQAQGHAIDSRSDLFSLGSVLYTMCTGRPPFRADSAVAMLRRVTDDVPRPIREINADIPDWLEAIIFKLLAKDPAERFQSAEEVAELLGEHLAHLQHPTTAPMPERVVPPKPTVGRASKPVQDGSGEPSYRRRWPLVARLAAVIAGVIFLGVVIHIVTDTGTIVIESATDEVQLVILEDGDEIKKIDVKKGKTRMRFQSGTYTIDLRGNTADFFLTKDNNLIIKRGWEVPIRIRSGDYYKSVEKSAPTQSEIAALLKDATLVMNFENETFSGSDNFSVRDLSGNGNDGTCLGKTTWRSDGKNAGALAVEGGGLKIDRPLIPETETFTVAGWFNLDDLDGPAGKNRWHVYEERLDENVVDLELSIDDKGTGGLGRSFRSPTARTVDDHIVWQFPKGHFPSPRKWFFAAWSYRKGYSSYTINEFTGLSGSVDLHLKTFRKQGQRHAIVGRGFRGMIDDVVVFNRALSKKELKKLYDYGRAGHSLPDVDIAPNQITEDRRFEGHTDVIRDVKFLAGGEQAVSASDDGSIRLWDVKTGREIRKFVDEETSPAVVVAQSPDKRRLVSGHPNGQTRVWDIATGKLLKRLDGFGEWSALVAFRRDGTLITLNYKGMLRMVDIDKGKTTRELQIEEGVVRAALSPDGTQVATAHDTGTIRIFRIDGGGDVQLTQKVGKRATAVAWSPDGRSVAAKPPRQDWISIFDVKSKTGTVALARDELVTDLAFTPDGRFLVVGGNEKRLNLWNVATGKQAVEVTASSYCVRRIAVSPNGKSVLSGGGEYWDKATRTWPKDGDFALRLWRLPESVWPKDNNGANSAQASPEVREDPAAREFFRKFERTLQEQRSVSLLFAGVVTATKDGETTRKRYWGAYEAKPGTKQSRWDCFTGGGGGRRTIVGGGPGGVSVFLDPAPYKFYVNPITRAGFQNKVLGRFLGDDSPLVEGWRHWSMWPVSRRRFETPAGERELAGCRTVAYTVRPTDKQSCDIWLWIDEESLVPRRRVVRFQVDARSFEITEQYHGYSTEEIPEPFSEKKTSKPWDWLIYWSKAASSRSRPRANGSRRTGSILTGHTAPAS